MSQYPQGDAIQSRYECYPRTRRFGLGNLGDTNVPVLEPTLTTAVGSGASVGTAALLGTSLAVPLIGAAIAGVTLAIGIWLNKNKVYHAQETAATHIVDQAEGYLKQNVSAWNGSNKTPQEQQQAIDNFNTIWGQVVQACLQSQLGNNASDPSGNPGTRCIEDRMPNGHTFMYEGQTYVGNGKWDWFSYYLIPITSYVQPQPTVSGSGSGEDILSSFASNLLSVGNDYSNGNVMPLMVILLLLAGGAYYMSNGDDD